VTFAWNPGRTQVEAAIRSTGPVAQMLTLAEDGVSVQEARPEDGDLHFVLPGATNRNDPSGAALMAGLPTLLIESDTIPPFRADVAAPPDAGGTTFDAVVSGADGGTGVARYELYEAYGDPPAEESRWRLLKSGDWPAPPLAGDVTIAVEARQTGWMHLAVRVWDRAGNASAAPSASQASVFVGEPTPWTPVAHAHLPALLRAFTIPGHEVRPTRVPATPASSPTSRPVPTSPPATPTAPSSAEPEPTSTLVRTPSPGCTPVSVRVTSPRGTELPPDAGKWLLRAFAVPGEAPVVSEAALGASQCVSFDPVRMEALALAPGYAAYPPQDLALSAHLALAVAPSAIVNGGFDAGLAGWIAAGEAPPARSTPGLAGAGAAVLGESAAGFAGANSASLGQEVDVAA
jgi:hypothetical protein